MVKFFLFISLAFASFGANAQQAQQQEMLTNSSILELTEFGFESDLIISKIESTPSNFDTSLDALKSLKTSNVPSAVIAAMVKASKVVKEDKTGIYFCAADGSEQLILPTAFSSVKTRGLAAALTYGIASSKIKSAISNINSKNVVQISDSIAFNFYFVPFNNTQIMATDWWFRAASSPNEFVLVRLTVNEKKRMREIETGKINMWVGADAGTRNADVVEFDFKSAEGGKFVVIPKYPLNVGEYCFFYKGVIPQGGHSNQSVFDFSVQ